MCDICLIFKQLNIQTSAKKPNKGTSRIYQNQKHKNPSTWWLTIRKKTTTDSPSNLNLISTASQRGRIKMLFKANTDNCPNYYSVQVLDKMYEGWWQAGSAKFKDVESAIKTLPSSTQGKPAGTNNAELPTKWLPSGHFEWLLVPASSKVTDFDCWKQNQHKKKIFPSWVS